SSFALHLSHLFHYLRPRPPRSTLFPYTTLFRTVIYPDLVLDPSYGQAKETISAEEISNVPHDRYARHIYCPSQAPEFDTLSPPHGIHSPHLYYSLSHLVNVHCFLYLYSFLNVLIYVEKPTDQVALNLLFGNGI